MGRKSQKDRKWKASTDQLRLTPSQKFIEKHEERISSPRSSSKKSEADSSASEKGSPLSTRKKRKRDGTRNRIPAIAIGGTFSGRERGSTIGARDGVSASEKNGTVSYRGRRDTFSFGTRDEYEDVPLQALEPIKTKHEESKANEELDRGGATHEDLAHQSFTIPSRREKPPLNRKLAPKITDDQFPTDHKNYSEIRHSPDRGSDLRPSESGQLYGSNDESHPNPSLTSVPNEGDNRQSHIEQTKRYTTENYPEKHAKHKNRSPESPFQDPDPGYGFPDDEGVVRKDFGSWNPPNQHESHDDPQPLSPEPNHTIVDTSDQDKEAASDLSQKPEETETLSETPRSSHNKERESLDSQPQQSGSGPSFVDASPIHDSVEEQVELETNTNDKAPDTPPSSKNANARPIHNPVEEPVDLGNKMSDKAPDSPHSPNTPENYDARSIRNSGEEQAGPPITTNDEAPESTQSSDTTNNVDASPIDGEDNESQDFQHMFPGNSLFTFVQPDFVGSGHVRSPVSQLGSPGSPDSPPQSPTMAGIVNWFSNDQVLPDNYYDVFPYSPRSPSPKLSSKSSDYAESIHTDSPIVSPADGQETFDEEGNPAVSKANVELPASHRDSSPLRPTSEEPEAEDQRGAEAATDIQGSQELEAVDEQGAEAATDIQGSQTLEAEDERGAQAATYIRSSHDLEALDERGVEALTDIERSRILDAFHKRLIAETATDRRKGSSRRKISWPSSISAASSVGSLLLSPDRDSTENPTNRANVQVDVEEAKENETKIHLIELHRANFELRTKLELREANFKREIQKAWKHPRPPPTTSEQRADKRALEKIESMKIFDELGDQQRPIRTEPQMVVWETATNIMITRARMNYLLEDFPKMYMHANHAVAAASQLRFPPLTAMCCYYRGMASYHHRDFATAKSDFEESRGCAGHFGISSEIIEKHIDLIDSADDPETAILQQFPAPRSKAIVPRAKRRATSPDVHDEDEPPSPSPADDAATLVEGSPGSPQDTALPLPPFTSLNDDLRSVGEIPEETKSPINTSRMPSPPGEMSLDDDDPQPNTSTDDDVPNYKPQEEAISEEIRKSIFESKAQSLDPVNEAGPTVANAQEKKALSPPSMASTEWTLLGSATSQGTTRRVPRPHIAPINTSLVTVTRPGVRDVSAAEDAFTGGGNSGEMDEDEIMAAFNTQREDATPDTPDTGY